MFFSFLLFSHNTLTSFKYALALTIIIFLSVLIHELTHGLFASKFGLKIEKVTLYAFGGIAKLCRVPDVGLKEFTVFASAPLMSLAVGLFLIFLSNDDVIINYAGWINIGMGLFNLIPIFPLDGSRILRSVLYLLMKKTDFVKTTYISLVIGNSLQKLLTVSAIVLLLLHVMEGISLLLVALITRSLGKVNAKDLLFIKYIPLETKVKDLNIGLEHIAFINVDNPADILSSYIKSKKTVFLWYKQNKANIVGYLPIYRVHEILSNIKNSSTDIIKLGKEFDGIIFTSDLSVKDTESVVKVYEKMLKTNSEYILVYNENNELSTALSEEDIIKYGIYCKIKSKKQ